jgi:hypothetical protein
MKTNEDAKGALYEVLRAEADHCANLLRQGKGPVLAYPDGMQLATLLGKAADEIERLRSIEDLARRLFTVASKWWAVPRRLREELREAVL